MAFFIITFITNNEYLTFYDHLNIEFQQHIKEQSYIW